jgi:hypothetical protein
MRHAYRDIELDLPDDWEDKTVLAFSAPARGPAPPPSVVVTRDLLAPGMSARTFAAKQLASSAQALPSFELEDSREITIGGQPAVDMRFVWMSDGGPVTQRQVVIAVGNTAYTMTQSAAQNEMATLTPAFDAMVQSLRFGPGAARAPEARPQAAPLPPLAPPVFRKNPF